MLYVALGNSIPRWESSFIITIYTTFAGTRSEIPDEIVFFSKCIPTPETFNFKFDSGPIFYKSSWSARQNKLIFSWQRWIFLNIHPRLANSPVYFPWPHCIYTVSENISLKKTPSQVLTLPTECALQVKTNPNRNTPCFTGWTLLQLGRVVCRICPITWTKVMTRPANKLKSAEHCFQPIVYCGPKRQPAGCI